MFWLEKTIIWLERMDVHVSTLTDGTVCSKWHANKMCLRSKQELFKQRRLWLGLNCKKYPKLPHCRMQL